MYIKADDFEVGMLILGTISEFSHEVLVGEFGTELKKVTTTNSQHVNQIYKIVAVQLPHLVVEVFWNSANSCIGFRQIIDTRLFKFIKPNEEFIKALKIGTK